MEVQEKAGCLIGKDYPERIVIHEEVSLRNSREMQAIKKKLLGQLNNEEPTHVHPSDEAETRKFMSFTESCDHHSAIPQEA